MFANITPLHFSVSDKCALDNLSTYAVSQPKGVNFSQHMHDPISDGHIHWAWSSEVLWGRNEGDYNCASQNQTP